jgi:hypothetical protein
VTAKLSHDGSMVRGVTKFPSERTGPMCIVDCPLCDQEVAFEPGDAVLDCPTCQVRVAVADVERPRGARAA